MLNAPQVHLALESFVTMEPSADSYDYSIVLGTSELREHIFAFADNTTLARCACVCSQWTDTALSLLWETMRDIVPLFMVLSPMTQNKGFIYPQGLVYSEDWTRFLGYACRIKYLSLVWESLGKLSDAAVDEVARRRPLISITPNLRELRIYTQENVEPRIINFSLLLLHEHLRGIVIRIPLDKALFSSFVNQLSLRTPNLESIELRADTPMSIDHFEDNVVKLLSAQKRVIRLCMPYHALTSRIIHICSHHRVLNSVVFNDGTANVTISVSLFLLPSLKDESFPALTELQIATTLFKLSSFASSACFTKMLQSITIQVISLENTFSLRTLLEVLAWSLPKLTHLTIDGIPQALNFDNFTRESMEVSQKDLERITHMKSLVEFRISWPVPLSVSNVELESLLLSLPQIEKLSLNSCPSVLNEVPKLNLDILTKLSKLCPNLRQLALFVDCTTMSNLNGSVFAELDNHRHLTTFEKLTELDLGLSPLCPDDRMLTTYLSRIIPEGCNFVYVNRWLSGVESIVEQKFGNLRENRWSGKYQTIEGLIKPLTAAIGNERRDAFVRIRELEQRIRAFEMLD